MAFDFKKNIKNFICQRASRKLWMFQKQIILLFVEKESNEEGGAYQQAIGVLYAVAYTLKMSYKGDYKIEGFFFEYVVPPLEGFWWQDNVEGVDYSDKSTFNWISVLRLPDFVTEKDFAWAVEAATKKKNWTVLQQSSLRLLKDYAFRLCMWVHLMRNHKALH